MSNRFSTGCLFLCGALFFIASDAAAEDDDSAAGEAFFESRIRPVLVKQCYECHAGAKVEGGLRVDRRSTIRKGGDRGPAVIPERPDASILLTAIRHADPDLQMPPKGAKLSAKVIADFRKWIEMGAPDPRADGDGDSGEDSDWAGFEAARDHWAYQAATESSPPIVDDSQWPRGDVDRFVLAALKDNDLRPSPDAEAATLLRRLHFDLVGLPPSPKSLKNFMSTVAAKGMDSALPDEVDRLLQSPHFGERWGRHWLDVARFGESSGGESNVTFPYAWRYRDYVIEAVNDDVPYDRFLTEQIAGDLLTCDSDKERARLLTATGFLAVGTKNLGENNDAKFKADLVDEQIDALTRAVMASSVACARCHHHKFDPFSMEDYYALAGIFASSKTYFGTFVSPANNRGGDPLVLPRVPGQQVFHKSLTPEKFQKLKAQFAELAEVRAQIDAAQAARFAGKEPAKTFTLQEVLGNIWRMGPVEGKLETLDENGKAVPVAMGVLDDKVLNVPLLARGEIGREGEIVPRAFPQAILVNDAPSIPREQSGRLELAEWLTNTQHPLTSRVFVNRVWKHLFGRGLVATVDNFGTSGAKPSHPELLDTLAVRFTNEGWSLKKLVRTLVLSRTYRQSSTFESASFQKDPENQWLWRMPKRRLEAEAIRDAMLVASGELQRTPVAGSLVATKIGDKPVSLIGLNRNLPKDLDGSLHRSVYLPVIRDRLPDVLSLFDFAEPSLVTGEREQTNVPVQALYLMNSDFVQARARAMAAKLEKGTRDDKQLIERAFLLCLARRPDGDELQRSLTFLQAGGDMAAFSFCQAMLCTAEFRNLD